MYFDYFKDMNEANNFIGDVNDLGDNEMLFKSDDGVVFVVLV